MSNELTIVGIDPGSRFIGLAAIRNIGTSSESLDGTLLTVKNGAPGEKLVQIYDDIKSYINQWEPDEISLEDVFSRVNVKTTILLSRVSGVILLLCNQMGIPVSLYPPAKVKAAVTGQGNATKEQVGYIVKASLQIEKVLKDDISDAYAVALCHTFYRRELFP